MKSNGHIQTLSVTICEYHSGAGDGAMHESTHNHGRPMNVCALRNHMVLQSFPVEILNA